MDMNKSLIGRLIAAYMRLSRSTTGRNQEGEIRK
jgi:hypothetical protein